jgi:hypothetical protein
MNERSNSSSIPECSSSRFHWNICIYLPTHMPRHLRWQSCWFSPSYEPGILPVLFNSSVTCQRPEATSADCWIIKWNRKVLEIQLDRRRDAATRWHCNIPCQQKRILNCRWTQCRIWCQRRAWFQRYDLLMSLSATAKTCSWMRTALFCTLRSIYIATVYCSRISNSCLLGKYRKTQ